MIEHIFISIIGVIVEFLIKFFPKIKRYRKELYLKKESEKLLKSEIEKKWNNSPVPFISKLRKSILCELYTDYDSGNIIFIDENENYGEEISLLYSIFDKNHRFNSIIYFNLNNYITENKIKPLIEQILIRLKIIKPHSLKNAIEEKFEYLDMDRIGKECIEKNIGIILFNLTAITLQEEYDTLGKLLDKVKSVIITAKNYSDKYDVFDRIEETRFYKIPKQDYFVQTLDFAESIHYISYKHKEYQKFKDSLLVKDLCESEFLQFLIQKAIQDFYFDSYKLTQIAYISKDKIIDFVRGNLQSNKDLLQSDLSKKAQDILASKLEKISNRKEHLNILHLISKIPVSIYISDLFDFMDSIGYSISIIKDLELLALVERTKKFRYVNWFVEFHLLRSQHEELAFKYLFNEENIIRENDQVHLPAIQPILDCPQLTKIFIEQASINRFLKREGFHSCNSLIHLIDNKTNTYLDFVNDFIIFLARDTKGNNNLRKNLFIYFLQKYYNLNLTYNIEDINNFIENEKMKSEKEEIIYYSILYRKQYRIKLSNYDKFMNDYGIYDYFLKTEGMQYLTGSRDINENIYTEVENEIN